MFQDQFRADLLVVLDRAMSVVQCGDLAEHLDLAAAEATKAKPAAKGKPRGAEPAKPTAGPSPGRRRAAAMLQRGFLNGAANGSHRR